MKKEKKVNQVKIEKFIISKDDLKKLKGGCPGEPIKDIDISIKHPSGH